MNYRETIDYMYKQLPMFHREGKLAYKANLDNIIQLAAVLNNPEKNFKSIHVAGTNGKGSVCHMLASVLQHAGYKTGLFTSPHLLDFRERIKINGEMVSEDYVTSFIEKHRKFIEKINPSFFELTTIMAFKYFAENNIDVAVIETGLGGRLDSTNIINPEVSVITNISFDHTDILGNTLAEIAGEKAGIIKQNVPVVIGESHSKTRNVFINKASFNHSQIIFADENYSSEILLNNLPEKQIIRVTKTGFGFSRSYELDLLGHYQQKNLLTLLATIDILGDSGLKIKDKVIESGLRNITGTTGLMGRWQILGHKPLIIADTGHNEEGLKATSQQLGQMKYKNLHIVFGMVKDKDVKKVLFFLPGNAVYYFTKANIPRALNEIDLLNEAQKMGLKGSTYTSVEDAIKEAMGRATSDDCIYIGGSTFIVGEALPVFLKV